VRRAAVKEKSIYSSAEKGKARLSKRGKRGLKKQQGQGGGGKSKISFCKEPSFPCPGIREKKRAEAPRFGKKKEGELDSLRPEWDVTFIGRKSTACFPSPTRGERSPRETRREKEKDKRRTFCRPRRGAAIQTPAGEKGGTVFPAIGMTPGTMGRGGLRSH